MKKLVITTAIILGLGGTGKAEIKTFTIDKFGSTVNPKIMKASFTVEHPEIEEILCRVYNKKDEIVGTDSRFVGLKGPGWYDMFITVDGPGHSINCVAIYKKSFYKN